MVRNPRSDRRNFSPAEGLTPGTCFPNIRAVKLEIPAGDYEAYLFDCDGTLADSMPVHYRAWCRALAEAGAGFEFGEDEFYSLGGVATNKIVTLLNQRHGTSLDAEAVAHEKELLFLQLLPEVRPLDAVVAYARAVAHTHPVAVVSGGFKNVVHQTLELIGMGDVFSVVVTPEDVVHGKPAPDMYLLAAEKLGVIPSACLVFEDAEPGILAAHAAGMKTVIIPSRIW